MINFKKIKPTIKNVYRKTLKAAFTTGLVFSSIIGGYNVAREVYEEIKGDNIIIDADLGLGSFVLFNKDTRNPMQVFDDMKNTALNVEGLEDAYKNGGSWTIEQKKEFIDRFATEIAKNAGVRLEKVEFVPANKIKGADGMYVGTNQFIFSVTTNKIYVADELLEQTTLNRAIEITYHEMVHFVEGVNVQTNKNTQNLNKRVFNANFNYGLTEVYRSNFYEISALLLTSEFKTEMDEKFKSNGVDYEYFNIHTAMTYILNEIIKNDIHYNGTSEDAYRNLTVKEVIDIGLKNNYQNKNVPYSQLQTGNSYTYEIITRSVPQVFLEANYQDFYTGALLYRNASLPNEMQILLKNIDDFREGNYENLLSRDMNTDFMTEETYLGYARQALAVQMLKISSILQYGNNEINKEDKEQAINTVLENLNLLPESLVNHYRLNAVENLEVKQIALNTQLDDEMGR